MHVHFSLKLLESVQNFDEYAAQSKNFFSWRILFTNTLTLKIFFDYLKFTGSSFDFDLMT